MEYIRIVNWTEFQHYKDRDPPWIKLHNRLLRSLEFSLLHDASKLLLILLWLVRSLSDGDIPNNSDHIRRLTSLKGKINLKPLIEQGFIEVYQDASKVLADCAPETEAERETEVEKKGQKKTYLDFVKLTEEEHSKLKEKLGDKGLEDYLERLNGYLGSKGKQYKSHYHTILNWWRKDQKDGNDGKTTQTGNGKSEKTGSQKYRRDYDNQTSMFGTTINMSPDSKVQGVSQQR